MKNKAVVLGANYYIGLSIIRCLGSENIDVVVVEYEKKNAYGLYSKYVSERLIAPYYKEKPKAFLKYLIDYAKKQAVKPVLYPSADPYVEFMDEHLEILSQYYLIPQTQKGLYTKAMNKDTLSELAHEFNMPVPESVSPLDTELEKKINEMIGFPCLVKPVDSPDFTEKFGKKLFRARDMEQLKKYIQKAKEKECEVIIQRIIPGFDDHMYTFDAYLNQESKVTHWMTAQKLRQYPINYGASVYTQQKYVQALYDIGAPFLESIGWKGFAEIEFKKDAKTGKFYLIEINVRTTNFNALIHKCGLNMPLITYKELVGQEIGQKAIKRDLDLVFWYAFDDLYAVKDYIKSGQLKFSNILKSYSRKKVHSTWDIGDPLPYFMFVKKKLRGIISRRFKR